MGDENPKIGFTSYMYDGRMLVTTEDLKSHLIYNIDLDRMEFRDPPPLTFKQRAKEFISRFPRALEMAWRVIRTGDYD